MKAIRIKTMDELLSVPLGEHRYIKGIPSTWESSGKMNYLAGRVIILPKNAIDDIIRRMELAEEKDLHNHSFPINDPTESDYTWYILMSQIDIIDSITHPEEFI